MLTELGKKLQGALKSLTAAPVISKELLDQILKQICAALLESDVNVKLVQKLRTNILNLVDLERLESGANKKRIIYEAIYKELVNLVDPGVEPYQIRKGKQHVLMMVGLQGAGKTTSCTKLAYHYLRKGYKTGLVCTDTYRAGAFDQLKQNATKAKIPYYGSYSESDPVIVALEGVSKFKKEGFEVIIVDTSGRHRQEEALFVEMRDIDNAIKPDHVVFVMDGTIGQAASSHATAFKESVKVGSIIITKMDGHAKGGGAISAVAATKSPIIFIGTGEHMHDLEVFNSQSFISKILGQGDLAGLMEKLNDSSIDRNSLVENITKGKFTMKDMKGQLEMISGLGPLSKIMGMIPGMANFANSNIDEQGGQKLKKFTCVMDSMTKQELESDGSILRLEPSRIMRLSKGSGVTVQEIQELIIQQSMMTNMVKGMGGPNGLLSNMAKMQPPPGHQRGAGQQIPPMPMGGNPLDMMKNTMSGGGAGGMQEMMKSMMSGGGMQDLMQSMMGGGASGMQSMMSNMMGGSQSSLGSLSSRPSTSTIEDVGTTKGPSAPKSKPKKGKVKKVIRK